MVRATVVIHYPRSLFDLPFARPNQLHVADPEGRRQLIDRDDRRIAAAALGC
jgi:hypothetical protein